MESTDVVRTSAVEASPPTDGPSVPEGRGGTARDRYLDAALGLIAAGEPLTLHRLARRVGRSHSAVYWHFRDLDDLVAVLVDREFADLLAGSVEGATTPRAGLLAVASAVRRAFRINPGLAAHLVRLARPERGLNAVSASVLQLLRELGLEGDDLATAYQALESLLIGATAFDFGRAPDHLTLRRRRLSDLGDPVFARVVRDDAALEEHNDRAFRFAVEAVLDACVDAAVAATAPPSSVA
jgi:AcrR family transcriptional regulator